MIEQDPIGKDIGPYHVIAKLGEGGMGVVYLAEQRQPLVRRVALKVIKLGMDSKEVLARFDTERRALAMMEHPAIAKVLDGGVTDAGRPYFAMEYVKGVPITDYCDQAKLSIEERIELFRAVCAGVQHAHHKGVMHRDLKPSNVLVTLQDGIAQPKIIDFGLAKATNQQLAAATLFTELGQVLGTPEYMSPEQAGLDGLDVDMRTDVYSLGVLLYELLVGDVPFPRKQLLQQGLMEMQRVIREVEPPKPSTRITSLGGGASEMATRRGTAERDLRRTIAGELDWIVLKALEKDRSRRYDTPQELAADLQRFLKVEPVLAGPPTVRYRIAKFVRRNRIAVGAGVTVAVVGVAASLSIAALYVRADRYLEMLGRMAIGSDLEKVAVEAESALEKEWSPRPRNEAALRDWLARAEPILVEAERVRIDAALFQNALAAEDRIGQALSRTYSDLVRNVARLAEDGGLVSRVRSRLESIRESSRHLSDAARSWAETEKALAEDELHRGLVISPQLGLVPLGRDPESRRFEFAHVLSGAVPSRDAQGRLQLDATSAIVLVLVAGDEDVLGSQGDRPDGTNYVAGVSVKESPAYTVRLAPYLLGKHEVTKAQWLRVMGSRGWFWTQERLHCDVQCHPMENASAKQLVGFLTAMDLELPTEAQWEYACRAGTETPWSTGSTRETLLGHANFADVSARNAGADWSSLHEIENWPGCDDGYAITSPVFALRPNAFGFHDMHGNVFELTSDPYFELANQQPREPGTGRILTEPPAGEARRTYRGGSFREGVNDMRSSNRFSVDAGASLNAVGFRVMRPVRPSAD